MSKLYNHIRNLRDIKFVDFLASIESTTDYWGKVRERCKNICSDSTIKRYQCYAEMRYEELGGAL